MTTIIFTFFLAFLASFFLTPFIGKIARRYNIVDMPSERKVHTQPIPRIGGVALFLSFFFPLILLVFNERMFIQLVESDIRLFFFVTGAVLIFGLGLWDDLRHLPSSVKFAGQILVGIFVYYGGINIHVISVPFIHSIDLGIFSLPVTVFWFVLVINAMNLADGLDGLAAGIALFVSLTMLVICLTNGNILEALGFAALGGALIAFLRYNFNPASIFMGDSGSYFLGYVLAALSILGSIKGQVATAMIIPVIALGIPLIDTMWAPIRRFALGKEMFQPDSGHLHHKLINLGYSHRRAVLLIYGCCIVLGMAAIIMIHSKDETAALVLLVVGSGVIFLGRYVGLRLFIEPGRIGGWLREVSDVTGITHERRSFLNHQVNISNSNTMDELWQAICNALKALEIDLAQLILYNSACSLRLDKEQENPGPEDRCRVRSVQTWKRHEFIDDSWLYREGLFKLDLPLLNDDITPPQLYGTLFIIKDIQQQNAGYYMLTRIEHLRRTINSTMEKINSQS
ncbi:MAG: undecaprenyl/decaprenyl-phosphate alpha-N-acetylglucosaminyl 1-phosphate transferase [Desulfobulbaceae bacterium]|nr:undecaprenyl/decaprenyl-phosphate alpha-N-acetylglucosaminyl 1-phosphate transferase [Desulfobulbaceae bacterium]